MAFFSKTNVLMQILQKSICIWNKKRHFLQNIFGEIIFKIITLVPGGQEL
jgi:hypothetical protein